ncbi:MAG: polysaccharide deacetylase family protein, partial [Lachnospiraceae bacterium]|nr:polysaccharide deacetylase family protein [Lachnospiraceae bacterium]
MSGKRKRSGKWNDKIKLALGELENKIPRDRGGRGKEGVWPEPEQVEAWNAERERQRGCGQYCGSVSAVQRQQTKEEYKRDAFIKNVILQTAKSAAFLLAAVALIQGAVRFLPDSITVSSSVGGRELPIYCVETDKKQVALSFDAAWGNEDTQEILSILKEHDIHVTFFMTGGWVEAYPDDVKAILDAGHDLGNHSENHKNMSELSDEEKTEELMAVHRKVKELTGYD